MKKILGVWTILLGTLFAGNVAPANDALYQKECASCHFGYQPALLSKTSWQNVMAHLNDHFGTDASLNPKEHDAILAYLLQNAGGSKLARDNTSMRITQSPKFIREHREIPTRLITQKEVGSLSNCSACHTLAIEGNYSERAIKIPNYGRWE